MSATCIFRTFIRDDSGVASVDWIVLSAACVALAMGVTNVVGTEMRELSYEIRAQLEQDMMNNPFDIDESGCVRLYLDPAADPGAAANTDPNSCSVGESNDSGQGNNGWGNGDQDAPGNSGDNTNAENSNNT